MNNERKQYRVEYRIKNKEIIKLKDKNRWRIRGRFLRRSKTLQDRLCMFCEVRLAASSVKMKSKKYCDGCRKNPRIKAYLRNIYMRRWRQKKKGTPQEQVILSKVGVKAKKGVVNLSLDK